jgi:hypothetical protein
LAWKRFGHALADVVGREAKVELQKEDAQGCGKVAKKMTTTHFFSHLDFKHYRITTGKVISISLSVLILVPFFFTPS